MNSQDIRNQIGESGLIIFDGTCGACSTFIGRKQAFFEKYGFKVVPLQEQWAQEITGLNEETLLKAIHLYTPEGGILRGVDFFQRVASKIWYLTPLACLLKISFLKPLYTFIYDIIARNRKKISTVCNLQQNAIYKN